MNSEEILKILAKESLTPEEKQLIADYVAKNAATPAPKPTEKNLPDKEYAVPAQFLKFIPDLPEEQKLAWIAKAAEGGLFKTHANQFGSEIKGGLTGGSNNPVMNFQLRPISQAELKNMPDEDFALLKSSGTLDKLLQNNMITD